MIPAMGGEPTFLTDDPPTDWNPIWSPDGRYIYFTSDRGGDTTTAQARFATIAAQTHNDDSSNHKPSCNRDYAATAAFTATLASTAPSSRRVSLIEPYRKQHRREA